MVRFLLRRLLFAALLVIAVSSGALLLTRLAPGDVTANLGAFAPPDEVARTRARFDLDRSPVAQWGGWALRASRFDFGSGRCLKTGLRVLTKSMKCSASM